MKAFYSHRHNGDLLSAQHPPAGCGSPAVKEDVERYLLGHAGKDVHAGYGEQWIKTLKAAIEIIPTRFKRHLVPPKVSQCSLLILEFFLFSRG
jgi:hypothetical protein